ncbi:heterokaryon incompatibility protein-domain-containing protein [Halenospora varia]|nr:heterokaryon incompatibility protein-domain-containing protein [Halenospora varia]
MSDEYQYQPLLKADSIRLINLQPSLDPTAPIYCSLIHTTLSSCDIHDIFSHYTALSYVWGSDQKVSTIWVDSRPLHITLSLFTALRDLRNDKRGFLLWADGICINQADDIEKSQQVKLMGEIYSNAATTSLYLGPAEPESLEFRCIASLRRDEILPAESATQLIQAVVSKDWFQRVWVFQELVLSSHPWVQCGKSRVKWPKLIDILSRLPLLVRDVFQVHLRLTEMHRAWAARHVTWEKSDMLELLKARRGLGVSDTRDMIFAHVGLARDGHKLEKMVDYSKTTSEVFTTFAKYLAEHEGIYNMLRCVAARTVTSRSSAIIENLPSWVPDWTRPGFDRLMRNHSTPLGLYTSRFLGDGILAMDSKRLDSVTWSTEELRFELIAAHERERVANKLVRMRQDYDRQRGCYEPIDIDRLRGWDDYSMFTASAQEDLKELYLDVYRLWKGVTPGLGELGHLWGASSSSFFNGLNHDTIQLLTSVQACLMTAFIPGLQGSLDGQCIAMCSSDRLALVPSSASAHRNDLVAPVSPNSGNNFGLTMLCRPLTGQIEEDLCWGRRYNRFSNSWGHKSNNMPQIIHCEYLGLCHRNQHGRYSRRLYADYNDTYDVIIALH